MKIYKLSSIRGYHSSYSDNISEFITDPTKTIETDTNTFNPQMGTHFATDISTVKTDRPFVYEFDALISNPLRMPDLDNWSSDKVFNELINLNLLTETDIRRFQSVKNENLRQKILQNIIQEKGFDSIIYKNEFEKGGDSYIVFDPKKITNIVKSFKDKPVDNDPSI